MSNFCTNVMLDNKCVCHCLVLDNNARRGLLQHLIDDFKYITDNIEFDDSKGINITDLMKDIVNDITDEKEAFDKIVTDAKNIIPALEDYKAKKYGAEKTESWLYEFFVMVAPVLKLRKALVDLIDTNKNILLKELKRINLLIDEKIDFINETAENIDFHVKELIDFDEINKVNSWITENGIIMDCYYKGLDETRNILCSVNIVEGKLKALINKLVLSGYEWAKWIKVPDPQ